MTNIPNDSIKLTIDKFIFRFPVNLKYSEAGLWIGQENSLVRLGLSDFAQQRNGDIAFAHLPPAGSVLDIGDEVASIETVKVNISLPSPIKGTVVEINSILQESPELINQEPYDRGWMVILRIEELERELRQLLDAEAYSKLARQQAEAELKSQ
jgi:glycine cleavage system H protein